MKKNKRKTFLINKKIVVILSIFAIILIMQISLSKYVREIKDEHAQESTQFYFESDIADINKKEYTINNWDGIEANKIDFYVRNHTNNLLKSEEDILYNMNITITDENGSEIENGKIINTYIIEKETENKISRRELAKCRYKQ